MRFLFLTILLFISGCITKDIQIESTKTWENHYFNTNDFIKATSNIQLENGESIWVLSNTTLKRLLTNTGK